jgi:tetratricopeptide (TPR) repeat protein
LLRTDDNWPKMTRGQLGFSWYFITLLLAAQISPAQVSTKEAFEAFTIGDYRTALKLYTEILNSNPTDTSAYFYQGLCYWNLGENDLGVDALETASRSKLFRARARYFIAKAKEASGAIPEALANVKMALKVDSTFAPAKKYLVQLFCASKQYDAALKAAEALPTAEVFLFLGNSLLTNGRYEAGLSIAKRALAVDSTRVAVKLLLADALSYSDSSKQACKLYNELFYHAGRYPRILKKLASCYIQAGQKEAGISYLKIYLAGTADSNVTVLSDIGRLYYGMSRFDSAAVYFKLSVRQDSTIAVNHYNLGLAYYQLKKYRAAEREVLTAISLLKPTIELYGSQLSTLGAIRMNQDKHKNAVQAYREALEVSDNCIDCYYFLGTLYQSLHDNAKAVTWFRGFLKRAPQNDRYADMILHAQESLKRITGASK